MKKDKKEIRSILLELRNDRSPTYSPLRAAEAGRALCRLVEGDYGVCGDCGTNIPETRLSVLPEAARCLECQSERKGQLVGSTGNV